MKKSTLGLIAVGVILVGGGGGCYVYQQLHLPTASKEQPAPSPAPTPTPTDSASAPAELPGTGTTVVLGEKDNGQSLRVEQGNVIDFVLHSTYWQIQPTTSPVLKPLTDQPVVKAALSNPPGMGTGTVEMQYQVVADGAVVLTASRTTCGEALKCTDAQSAFTVTILSGAGTVAPPPPTPSPTPEPSPAPVPPTPTPTPTPAPAPITNASVLIAGMAFQAASVTVQAGATVTWTNQDPMAHTVTADDGSFDSGALAAGTSAGTTFSHTFTKPGTYAYHCSFHASMHGTVVVE